MLEFDDGRQARLRHFCRIANSAMRATLLADQSWLAHLGVGLVNHFGFGSHGTAFSSHLRNFMPSALELCEHS
jgi:hypothetical protein